MTIDILFFLLMLGACYKGYTRGFIVAVFSFFAFMVGLAAALKLSATVAVWLKHATHIGNAWLPFLSFIIVMVGVVFLVRMIAKMLQKTAEMLLLGWANKIGGILLYAIIYTMIFSVLLFFGTQLGVLKTQTFSTSIVYPFVAPWGERSMNFMGKLIPLFKNMFAQLESFFDMLKKK